jgi:hypothetical protein
MSGLQIRNVDVETQDRRQLKPGETRRVPTSGIGCERGRVTEAIGQMDEAGRFCRTLKFTGEQKCRNNSSPQFLK